MENWITKIKNKIITHLTTLSSGRYEFSIPETSDETLQMSAFNNAQNKHSSSTKPNENTSIFSNLNQNLKYMKIKYNTLINSDIVIREFTLRANNNQYKAFLFYIDGMSDTKLINDFVLKPLMLKNTSNSLDYSDSKIINTQNDITVKKNKKVNLENVILNSLLPQNAVKKEKDFSSIISGINSGNCALFIDTLNIVFNIDVKGFKQRAVESPNNEIVIKGPQSAFVENIRTNTSLLRQFVNSENLVIENIQIGKISKTVCSICYMKNITNDDLVAEVKYRLNGIRVDSLLSSRRT